MRLYTPVEVDMPVSVAHDKTGACPTLGFTHMTFNLLTKLPGNGALIVIPHLDLGWLVSFCAA